MAREVVVRPTGTSWGAVLDGWLASVGVAAILTPIVVLLLANVYTNGRGYAATVPILCAVGLAYLIGGYVAGRMAGYRTSWHGMMVAFFGVFVVLALLVVDLALEMGVLGTSGRLVQLLPAVLGVALFQSAETFAFGGVLGVLIAVFAGWLGGLLAPARITAAATTATPAQPEVHKPRERFRLLPSAGRKGGERMDEVETVEHTEHVDRT
ncbi:MAG TPA: hypothetical protein VGA38_05100 [Candidatus Limnocylindria bacterium]